MYIFVDSDSLYVITAPDYLVECLFGKFGQNCNGICNCSDDEKCDVLTGDCSKCNLGLLENNVLKTPVLINCSFLLTVSYLNKRVIGVSCYSRYIHTI